MDVVVDLFPLAAEACTARSEGTDVLTASGLFGGANSLHTLLFAVLLDLLSTDVFLALADCLPISTA